jgi:hypothetical protein
MCQSPDKIQDNRQRKRTKQDGTVGLMLCLVRSNPPWERVAVDRHPGRRNGSLFFQETVEGGSIALYDIALQCHKDAPAAQFAFFLRSLEELQDPERQFELSVRDISLLNPNTRTCPIFRTRHDAELTKAIYRRVPILLNESGAEAENPWGLSFMRMLDMATDSSSFRVLSQMIADGWTLNGNIFERDGERYLPLYEAKMIHQFNHRFGDYADKEADDEGTALPDIPESRLQDPDYAVEARYWVPETAVIERIPRGWNRSWLIGWRRITNATNERTMVAAVLPAVGAGDSVFLGFPSETAVGSDVCLVANFCAIAFDYVVRQKLGGVNLLYFIAKQLPVMAPSRFEDVHLWMGENGREWIWPRVLELEYTAWNLRPFAVDCGWSGPPFRWDEGRRFVLRSELDAAFFHLYLPAEANGDWSPAAGETVDERARLKASFPTPRAAVAYILDTFPIVKRKDEANWDGDYRTKRVILEIYDAMAEAARTGIPYQTRLSPPPADAAVAHPWPEEIIQVAAVSTDRFSDIAALPDEEWATPVGVTPENVALFSLIDILQTIGEAVDPERIRLAAILVRKPMLAAAFMDDAQAKQWLRLIGQEARPVRGNVVQISQFQKNGVDYPWAEAIRQLRGSGALVVGSDGKWSAGGKMPASSSQDWITGRAAIAVQLLSAIDPARVEQKLIAFNRSVEDGTARRAVS